MIVKAGYMDVIGVVLKGIITLNNTLKFFPVYVVMVDIIMFNSRLCSLVDIQCGLLNYYVRSTLNYKEPKLGPHLQ